MQYWTLRYSISSQNDLLCFDIPIFVVWFLVWGNTYKTYPYNIFKLQKKLARIMLFKKYNQDSKPFFQKLNILLFHVSNISILTKSTPWSVNRYFHEK